MDSFWQDVRFTVRAWRKSPAFTFIIVLTLAFGIGANTTAFTIVNTLFLNPLPVDRPAELVAVRTVDESARSTDALPISYPNLTDIRDRNEAFASVAGHSRPMPLALMEGETPRRLFGEFVTGNYFDTLGIRPSAGRFFLQEEDVTPGAAPVLVLAHAAWLAKFGGAPDLVGRTMRINGVMFTVVGVAPEGFKGVNVVFGPDVWIPATMAEAVSPVQMKDWLHNRSALGFRGVARLKPGTSASQANANVATFASALQRDYPDANEGRGLAVDALTRAALMAPGQMSATSISLVLLAVPALMLLIACSNVANLLLARAAGRRREMAVRLAVGAGRQRLVRQLLTESSLLATLSGLAGFGLAYAGVQLLWSFRPPEVAANLIDVELDAGVFLFALALSLATGVIFGLFPAWQSSRADVVGDLKTDERAIGEPRRGFAIGGVLIAGQVTLSLVALVTAGLLLRSLQEVHRVDPGFETRRLGIAMVSPGQAGYSRVRGEQFYADVRARVSAIPGVESVSWATQLPLFASPSQSVVLEGREDRDRASAIVTIANVIDTGYFAATGISRMSGRDFTDGDRDGTAPVAIVNETLAARVWPGLDPIGRRLRLAGDTVMREVVGVAKTANYTALGEAPQPCLYLPIRQQYADAAVLYFRTAVDPTGVLATVQRAVRTMDSRIEMSDVRTVETVINQSLFGATLGVALLTLFGFLALGLASLGLYGAMAYGMRQRQREIGVRMALGARRQAVLRLALRQGLAPVAIGVVIGTIAAVVVGRALSGVLFGVSPLDPISLTAAPLILALAATAACYVPARRASRVDPVVALREH